MRYFVDIRNGELITENEINNYMAPECYYEYSSSGSDGMFIEKWYIGNESFIDFGYTMNDYNLNRIPELRNEFFTSRGIKPICLNIFYVPSKIFKETINKYIE